MLNLYFPGGGWVSSGVEQKIYVVVRFSFLSGRRISRSLIGLDCFRIEGFEGFQGFSMVF